MRSFDDGPNKWLSFVTQPWLMTVLVIQGVGAWIYLQQAPIDELSWPVYGLSLVSSLAFWHLINRGVEILGTVGRAVSSLVIALAVALLLVGSYQCYVEFGEFFSASMLEYAGQGGTSTFLRYLVEYLAYPLDLFFFGTIPVMAVVWYAGAPTRPSPNREGYTAFLTALGIFLASFAATTALASGRHLSADTALLTAGVRSFAVPDAPQLRATDRRDVPELSDARASDQPNVLFIVNESLGTQEIDWTGERHDQMPQLQKWISRSPSEFFPFERAYANSTSTDLSVPSMLTGVGPDESVERFHEMPMVWDWARGAGLSPFYVSAQNYSATTFPEFFFSGDPMPVFTPNSVEGRAHEDYALDELVAAEAFEDLLTDVPQDRPFFAVYNSNAMHKPFQQTSPLLDEQPNRGSPYRNALAILDRALGRIIDALREQGRLENTVIIMTSDHGEYDERIHDVPRILSLYDEFIRVPMLVRLPKSRQRQHPDAVAGLKANRERNVTNLDLVPTVIDLLGYDTVPEAAPVREKLSGKSLLSPVPEDRTIIALNNNAIRHWEHKGFGIVWRDWRFVFTDVEGPRLFDIGEDPRQQHDLWNEAPPEVRDHILSTIRNNETLEHIWTSHHPSARAPAAAE